MHRALTTPIAFQFGGTLVPMTNAVLTQVCSKVNATRPLVFLNLIAYGAFAFAWWASDYLDADDDLGSFRDAVHQGVIAELKSPQPVRMMSFLQSRNLGFITALANLEGNSSALANYFQGCCSVDRVEIAFSDVYPNADDLEFMLTHFGGTQAGKDLLARIRSIETPATYPMNSPQAAELMVDLSAISAGIRAIVRDRARL